MSPSDGVCRPYGLTVLREETGNQSCEELRSHALRGLTLPNKALSSKYFYDDIGSELFARITEQPEYYLTNVEYSILEKHASTFVQMICPKPASSENSADRATPSTTPVNIVELGAGDGRKTKVILRALMDAGVAFEYIPVDISSGAMSDLFGRLSAEFQSDELSVHGIVADHLQALAHISERWPSRRTVVLFLGSSIGNFTRDTATAFFCDVRANLKQGDMLFSGFDLKKDPDVLFRAYSDSAGVTRDFNLNLLTRLNKEAGANFNRENFLHHAIYNPVRGAMESYLISRCEHTVVLDGHTIRFDLGEPIHMEYSHKYLPKEALAMMQKAGFSAVESFFDDREWFLDALVEIVKVS